MPCVCAVSKKWTNYVLQIIVIEIQYIKIVFQAYIEIQYINIAQFTQLIMQRLVHP